MGMTNGEKLCVDFPNMRYTISEHRVITTIGVAASFDLDWWNAEYHVPIMKIGAYLDGYEKGTEVLNKIRAEIEAKCCITVGRENEGAITLHDVFKIIDKYNGESYRNVVGSIAEGVQNIVIAEGMTNAEVFTKIYGYQPATDSVVCNKDDWCGNSEPCKYCSCVGDAIGREEDWWNSPYKRGAADGKN